MARKTLQLDAGRPGDLTLAAELLRSGGLVAFATETVYGLGANALSAEAVAGIFAAKQRPAWDPLIVHLPDAAALPQIATVPARLHSRVDRLVAAHWPGPLTLLLPRRENIPDVVTAGRPLVGVRIPAHPAARDLLRLAGVPVAAPSANRFGHTSPTTAQHGLYDLNGRIDAVLDAGPCRVGLESTVVDPATTPMTVYRPGGVSLRDLEASTGVPAVLFVAETDPARPPQALPSPGVGIRHYAPRARLVLIESGESYDAEHWLRELAQFSVAAAGRIGVMLPADWDVHSLPADVLVEPWGDWDRPATLAASLFAALRSLDSRGVETIVCPLPPAGGLRDALRDRLLKAAREK